MLLKRRNLGRVSFLFSPRSGINPLGDAKIVVLRGSVVGCVIFFSLRSGIIPLDDAKIAVLVLVKPSVWVRLIRRPS